MAAIKVTCPKCGATLKSSRPLRAGKKVTCPQCSVPFTVTAENTRPASSMAIEVPPLPGAAPADSDKSGLNIGRLALVLGGTLLYLGGGAGLGYYCFVRNKSGAHVLVKPVTTNRSSSTGSAANGVNPVTPPKPAVEPSVIVLPPEDQARVNEAIIRGVRYLKTTQTDNGTWPGDPAHLVGYSALPALVLLECGVPASDPNVQKAAVFVRSQCPALQSTYELALAILFLDLLGDTKDENVIKMLALRLVANQNATGGWDYTCPPLTPENQQKLLAILKAAGSQSLVAWSPTQPPGTVTPAQQALPVLQELGQLKEDVFRNFGGDNSNTQFAILALWAARRHGIPLERTVALTVMRFRSSQGADGTWSYHPGQVNGRWPAMTCAGLLALAIGHGLATEMQVPDKRAEADPAIQKALALLASRIGQPLHKLKDVPLIDLYFLWSLERVGVLYNLTKIGDKDWYGWGSEMLLANQQPRGNWQAGENYPGTGPITDTCFGLLFLKQANLAKDLSSKLQLLGGAK